jgi:hypothetical protein
VTTALECDGVTDQGSSEGLSRRELLGRATLLAGGALLAGLPDALRIHGWLEDAYAAGPNVVEQTVDGLVAFIVPGRDGYSAAQAQKSATPGGIEAGATPAVIRTLDRFLPSNPPLSATAATILNQVATTVRPASAHGKFASAFANLSFADKAKVFQTIEGFGGTEAGSIRFLFGNLPDLVAFVAYSEAGVFDRRRGRLRRRPLGWSLTRYSGTSDGRAEFKGYLEGRRAAEPSA